VEARGWSVCDHVEAERLWASLVVVVELVLFEIRWCRRLWLLAFQRPQQMSTDGFGNYAVMDGLINDKSIAVVYMPWKETASV
jgi:hypothetical protein